MAQGPYVMHVEGGWNTIERPAGFPICKPYGSHPGSDAPRNPQMEVVGEGTKLTFERMQKLWSILRREWSLRGGVNDIGIGTSGDPDVMVTADDIKRAFKTTLHMYQYDKNNHPADYRWDLYNNRINNATDYSHMESASYGGNPTYCVLGVSHGNSTDDSVTGFEEGSPNGTVKYKPWGNMALQTDNLDQWVALFVATVEIGDKTFAEFFNRFLVGAANLLSNTCVCNCNYCTCFGDEVCSCHVVRRYGWCYAYIY